MNWYSPPNSFLCHSDITFDRLCLASQHTWNIWIIGIGQTGLEKMGISFEMPVGHLNKTGLEIPFYARWASLFDRLCLASLFDRLWQAIRLLKKITLILMTPDWCRDEMPVGHLFNFAGNTPAVGMKCLLRITLKVPFYARWASFFDRLCLALIQALPGFDTGNTPNYMIMTFLWPFYDLSMSQVNSLERLQVKDLTTTAEELLWLQQKWSL